jgi:hypothetical protein
MLWCESTIPLGLPVLPEEKMIVAGSSGEKSFAGQSADAGANSALSSARIFAPCGMPLRISST